MAAPSTHPFWQLPPFFVFWGGVHSMLKVRNSDEPNGHFVALSLFLVFFFSQGLIAGLAATLTRREKWNAMPASCTPKQLQEKV